MSFMSSTPLIARPTLETEACMTTISALSNLLRRDFSRAKNRADLNRRLANKGFAMRKGFLETVPQGKQVCSLDRLY
ncbi:MAG: hypothetical protein ACPG5U_02725 [Planktomarina sp.]